MPTPGALDRLDREALEFLAAHRMALADHVMVLLGGDRELASERLAELERMRLVWRERVLRSDPDCFRITRAGLSFIGSDLPPPEFDPRYQHDVGVAWLWLAATHGAFGETDRVLTEREMRATDATESRSSGAGGTQPGSGPAAARPRFGVPLADENQNAPLQYPDLFLIRGRHRIPVHLQLAAPSPRRLTRLLAGYAPNAHATAVLFLVTDPKIGGIVRSAATAATTSPTVHIQPARFD